MFDNELDALTKANKYLKNISAGMSFFVVLAILAICLAICGGGSTLLSIF